MELMLVLNQFLGDFCIVALPDGSATLIEGSWV